MSSLRLALKQSLADAVENTSPSTEGEDGEEEEFKDVAEKLSVALPSTGMSTKTRPGVGVGVVVVSATSGKIYAGIRRGSHGAKRLALPGGHLEHGETWATCATREVAEEMGVQQLDDLQFLHVTNDIMVEEGKHYVTIFMIARTKEVPINLEPDKCEGWEDYSLQELSSRVGTGSLFLPLENLLTEDPKLLRDYLD